MGFMNWLVTGRILAMLAVLALAACTAPAPAPDDSFYRLGSPDPEQVFDTPPLQGTVEVSRFSSSGMGDERALLYSEDGGQSLNRYNYHFWSDAPTIMLRDALVEALRAANAAERVVTPALRVEPDYRLDGRILRLEHHKTENRVVVAVEFAAIHARGEDLLLLETYREEEPVNGSSADAAAQSVQPALNRLLQRFIADLADLEPVQEAM